MLSRSEWTSEICTASGSSWSSRGRDVFTERWALKEKAWTASMNCSSVALESSTSHDGPGEKIFTICLNTRHIQWQVVDGPVRSLDLLTLLSPVMMGQFTWAPSLLSANRASIRLTAFRLLVPMLLLHLFLHSSPNGDYYVNYQHC